MNHHLKKIFMVFISLQLLAFVAIAQSKVVLYNAPDSAVKATEFQVKVNGQESFAYKNDVSTITYFSFEGKVAIEISSTHDIKWVDIRPKNLGIEPVIKESKIYFSISKPCQLSVEINGESTRPVYIFASPLEKNIPSALDKNVIFFEKGKIHYANTIKLQSNQSIYIEGGAIVRGVIEAENANNIKVLGRGILEAGFVKETRPIYLYQCENIEIEGIILLNNTTWTLVPHACNKVNISNIKIVSWAFGSDGIDLVATSHVSIKDCFLRCNDDCIVVKCWGGVEKYPETPTKGVDVTNIQVSNTVFWNMAWGNTIDIGFELRCDKISNISFKNCDVIHVDRGAVFSIHNGDYAMVQDILYEDIRVEDAMHKLIDIAIFLSQYSLDRPTNAEERKARYKQGVWDGVLKVYAGEEEKYEKNRGYIKNITFKNISVTDGQFPYSVISGYDSHNHQVENVLIQNLVIHGKRMKSLKEARVFVEHGKGIEIK
jgi:polygalacturonase